MRRSLWIAALLVVLAAFAVFQQYSSWSLVRSGPSTENAADRQSGDQTRDPGARGVQGRAGRSREAVPVLAATVQQKVVPVQIRAVGNVEAYSTVSIKSQVTGVLTQAHFKEGQDVNKGQLLFTIDPRPLEAALKQAEATLARDFAQVQNWREQARRCGLPNRSWSIKASFRKAPSQLFAMPDSAMGKSPRLSPTWR